MLPENVGHVRCKRKLARPLYLKKRCLITSAKIDARDLRARILGEPVLPLGIGRDLLQRYVALIDGDNPANVAYVRINELPMKCNQRKVTGRGLKQTRDAAQVQSPFGGSAFATNAQGSFHEGCMRMWTLDNGDIGETEDLKSVESYSFFDKGEDKPPRSEIDDITKGSTRFQLTLYRN